MSDISYLFSLQRWNWINSILIRHRNIIKTLSLSTILVIVQLTQVLALEFADFLFSFRHFFDTRAEFIPFLANIVWHCIILADISIKSKWFLRRLWDEKKVSCWFCALYAFCKWILPLPFYYEVNRLVYLGKIWTSPKICRKWRFQRTVYCDKWDSIQPERQIGSQHLRKASVANPVDLGCCKRDKSHMNVTIWLCDSNLFTHIKAIAKFILSSVCVNIFKSAIAWW